MPKPNENTAVTQLQIDGAVNAGHINFKGATPDTAKNWHTGEFESWAYDKFGYGKENAFYGGTLVNGAKVHIYYLPDRDGFILLRANESPATYNVK